MNIQIVKNKYLNAGLLLMLFSAIVHMLVLFYIALTTSNLHILNYFNILSISYFIPGIQSNITADVISVIVVLLIYGIIFKVNKTEK